MPVNGAILCAESDFGVPTPQPGYCGVLHPQIEPNDIESWTPALALSYWKGLGVEHVRSQCKADYDFCRKIGAHYQYITAGVWDQNWYTATNPPNTSGEPYNNWSLYESRITADANYWLAKIDAGDTYLLDHITFEPWNEPDSVEGGGTFWRGTVAQYIEMSRRMINAYRAVLGPRARFSSPGLYGYEDTANVPWGSRRVGWGHNLAAELYATSNTWERYDFHWLGRRMGGALIADTRGLRKVLQEIRGDFEYDAANYTRQALRLREVMVTELGFREETYNPALDKIDTAIHPAQVFALVDALERGGANGAILAACSPHADEPTIGGMLNATVAAPLVATTRSTYLAWKMLHEMRDGRVLSGAWSARDNAAAIVDGQSVCFASKTGFGGTATTVGTDPGVVSAIFYGYQTNTNAPGTGNTVRHVHRNIREIPRLATESQVHVTEYALPYGTAAISEPALIGPIAGSPLTIDDRGALAWNSTQDAEHTRLFRFTAQAA